MAEMIGTRLVQVSSTPSVLIKTSNGYKTTMYSVMATNTGTSPAIVEIGIVNVADPSNPEWVETRYVIIVPAGSTTSINVPEDYIIPDEYNPVAWGVRLANDPGGDVYVKAEVIIT